VVLVRTDVRPLGSHFAKLAAFRSEGAGDQRCSSGTNICSHRSALLVAQAKRGGASDDSPGRWRAADKSGWSGNCQVPVWPAALIGLLQRLGVVVAWRRPVV